MPLTKQDKKDIKDIFLEAFESFALAIQNDFNRINERLDRMAKQTVKTKRLKIGHDKLEMEVFNIT